MGFVKNKIETRNINEAIRLPLDGKVASVGLKVGQSNSACLYGFGETAGVPLSAGEFITIEAKNTVEDTGVLDGEVLYIDWPVAATTKSVTLVITRYGECLDL